MKIANITGMTGKHIVNGERTRNTLPLVFAFIAGLVVTACLALWPMSNDTLLPQPTETNPAPRAPAMPYDNMALV